MPEQRKRAIYTLMEEEHRYWSYHKYFETGMALGNVIMNSYDSFRSVIAYLMRTYLKSPAMHLMLYYDDHAMYQIDKMNRDLEYYMEKTSLNGIAGHVWRVFIVDENMSGPDHIRRIVQVLNQSNTSYAFPMELYKTFRIIQTYETNTKE